MRLSRIPQVAVVVASVGLVVGLLVVVDADEAALLLRVVVRHDVAPVHSGIPRGAGLAAPLHVRVSMHFIIILHIDIDF